MLPAERITSRAATAGTRRSVTTKTRKPLGKVLPAALGNSKARGAPAGGISGTSFTPGGTIPEAFCGSCDEEGVDSLRDTGGADCCAIAAGTNAAVAATNIAARRKIDWVVARFIVAPENVLRMARSITVERAPPA